MSSSALADQIAAVCKDQCFKSGVLGGETVSFSLCSFIHVISLILTQNIAADLHEWAFDPAQCPPTV